MENKPNLPDEPTSTFRSNDARRIHAHQQIQDFGGAYFNPLIGESAAETCEKTERIMAFLYNLFSRDLVDVDLNDGLKMIIKTAWTAMQYERDVADLE